MTALVQGRRVTGWHILGATAVFLSAVIAVAVARGVVWVIVHGVGYLIAHAWWAR